MANCNMTGLKKSPPPTIQPVLKPYYLGYCTFHDDGFLFESLRPMDACCPDAACFQVECIVQLEILNDELIVGAYGFSPEEEYERRGGGWTRRMFLYSVYGAHGIRQRLAVADGVQFK